MRLPFPSRRSSILPLLASVVPLLVGARVAGAQPASPPPPATGTTEYAVYVGQGLDGGRTFATSSRDVRGKNWDQFADRLQVERFPSYPRAEPAFFTWLATQGWELVQCERREEQVGLLGARDDVTRCYFRRTTAGAAVATPAPPPAATPSPG